MRIYSCLKTHCSVSFRFQKHFEVSAVNKRKSVYFTEILSRIFSHNSHKRIFIRAARPTSAFNALKTFFYLCRFYVFFTNPRTVQMHIFKITVRKIYTCTCSIC